MRLHSRFVMAMALTGAGLFCASAAQAASDVFSYINPVGGFDRGDIWCITAPAGNCSPGFTTLVAQPFQPIASGKLDHLDLAIANYAGATELADGVAIALVADNGKGTAPEIDAPALEEWTITKLKYTLVQKATLKLTKVASKLHPALSADKIYWIILSPTGYDSSVVWFWNNLGAGTASRSFGGGPTCPSSTNVAPACDVWEQ